MEEHIEQSVLRTEYVTPRSCSDRLRNGSVLLPNGSLDPCFVDGPLLALPGIIMMVFGPYALYRLYHLPKHYRGFPWFQRVKLFLIMFQVAICGSIGWMSWHYGIRLASHVTVVGSLLFAINIHLAEMQRSLVPDGVLLFYWLITIVVYGVKLLNLYYNFQLETDASLTALYAFAWINSIFVFTLEYRLVPKLANNKMRAGTESEEDEKTLLDESDVFKTITLSYMNPLVIRASNGSLSAESLPNIKRDYKTARHSQDFQYYWNRRKSDSNWTLVVCLFEAFGSFLASSIVFELFSDLAKVALPFLLKYIIEFAKSYADGGTPQPVIVGIYIAMAMFCATVLKALLNSIIALQLQWAAASVKSSLTNTVFNKSLHLSNKERGKRSVGEIVNLMSVDIQKITTATYNLVSIWECPIQFALCMFGLYQLVGPAAFSAVLIMIVFVPINSVMTRYIRKMRTEQMHYKDMRTRLTTEIFSNIKSLKLYNWENALLDRLYHVRNDLQLKNLRHIIYVVSTLDFIWKIIPYLLSATTFTLFMYLNGIPLTPEIAFPAMSLFRMLTVPIADVPKLLTRFVDCGVSISRVRDFLICDEIDDNIVKTLPSVTETGQVAVRMEHCTFVWDKHDSSSTMLQDINFTARKGQLNCIVGKVGAGKTSFLKAILGDVSKLHGEVTVHGIIAYVSQDAWLMNATVKENILFGSKFDPDFYEKTIDSCCLRSDLEILPDGDDTEIGERGVSLSGGQKARLGLARAVYARADVYLMDDPLSAVDEHVSRHIMRNVICNDGLLGTKTRILATNSISVLSKSDEVYLLENERILEYGTFPDLLDRKGHVYDLVTGYGRDDSSGDSDSESDTIDNDSQERTIRSRRDTLRRASLEDYSRANVSSLPAPKKTAKSREKSAKGRVKWNVYKRYAKACGKFPLMLSMLFITLASMGSLFGNLWIKSWVESPSQSNLWFWIGGFICVGVITAVLASLRRIVCRVYCGLEASKRLHDQMVVSVTRSPMVFFETTPIGRVINRFSGDVNELDENLQTSFIDLGSMVVRLFVAIGVVIFSAPVVLLVIVPLSFLYNYYQKYYQSASRELKRLLSISKSPIFAHFQESLNGVSTIRAFNQLDRFKHMNETRIDVHIKIIYLFRSMNRWLSVRLQTLGALVVLTTVCVVVFGATKNVFSPGMIGIMLTYVLEVTDLLSSIVRAVVSLETSIVGAERVLEYCDLEGEKPDIIEENRPPTSWPNDGVIKFENYSTRYRANLDPVLEEINLSIKSKEKVGIVGRTGAGKSSLVLALFRIIEPIGDDAKIMIDGVDATKIGLHDLRSNLSIIPQDSQVFQGTIRQNIDPFGLYSDDDVWRVLGHSHLKNHVESMEDGLSSTVNEGGSNLSTGQRQLMCLCRALLHTSSILVLDEATASVDVETDQLVQETIRREFKDKTIVTIAHRLNTVMDSDKIVVIEKGRVAEVGSPDKLLTNRSLFYSLCREGGVL